MEIVKWGWETKDETNSGWFIIECKSCIYTMLIENGYVKHGIYSDKYSLDNHTVYPFRNNEKFNYWGNASGRYTLPYFKRLLKSGEIMIH